MHRYSQSTFHEGAHRQAPGDSTPWRDAGAPMHRIRAWWLAPAAKGSMIAAWGITLVLGTYCYSLQTDAKTTYMLNNVLLRNLHQESLRADASEDRARELQLAVKSRVAKDEQIKSNYKADLKNCAESQDDLKRGIVNYELELAREKARTDLVQERNQGLVKEMHAIRTELASVKKDNQTLVGEVDRLRKAVRRLESV
ncbi:membrane-associated protein, putative [Bodo saltans]|uniref:Membrane-associated protein, putative n=1 Tax=Bodo saltans TaxID=75058 RepID=A0A0S4KLR7_BODSA|nr:membrane-associated protein, putative [Bodo saltans]|eukprot:CUI14434.1 membrane-associated protein, putative [Bodo saltans]